MNKKGFTFIEMLAVIVIFAIISSLTVIITIDIIDAARISSYKTSVLGSMHSFDNLINLKGENLSSIAVTSKELPLENNNFESGNLTYNIDTKLVTANLVSDGTYCADGERTNLIVVKGSCDLIKKTKASGLEANPSEVTIYAGDEYNILDGVSLKSVSGDNIDVVITYTSDPLFDNNVVGIYQITYKAIYRNITYTAQRTVTVSKNVFSITYYLDEGTVSSNPSMYTSEDETFTINNPTKNGYDFEGWSETAFGSERINPLTIEQGTTGNKIYYAHYIISKYTLTVNIGENASWSGITPQLLTYKETAPIPYPVRDGYVFSEWSVSGNESSINETTFTMGSENTVLTAIWYSYSEMFTYTGNYEVKNDGSFKWRVKLLTSGIFTPLVNMNIDAFLVGGGGGGGRISGGGGGYTKTVDSINLPKNNTYSVTIGAGGAMQTNGGKTSGFGQSANGGQAPGGGGSGLVYVGGAGGSGGGSYGSDITTGGTGGWNGSNGGYDPRVVGEGGPGQGSTTREFAESSGALYSGGGGGGGFHMSQAGGAGGAGGGGHGTITVTNGTTNTGGGGGGGNNYDSSGASGGSGILVIRNHR